jgi:hypothetical protein
MSGLAGSAAVMPDRMGEGFLDRPATPEATVYNSGHGSEPSRPLSLSKRLAIKSDEVELTLRIDGENSISRVALCETGRDGRQWHVEFPRPFGDGECSSIEGQPAGVMPVAALFLASSPTAIGRTVPLATVDAVETGSLRTFPHVSEEVVKDKPPFTDTNASSAILLISGINRIGAARNHCSVRVVGWRDSPRCGSRPMPMPGLGAATGSCLAADDMVRVGEVIVAAIAPEPPPEHTVFPAYHLSSDEQSVAASCNVVDAVPVTRHREISHRRVSSRMVVRGRYGGCTPAGLAVLAQGRA